MRVVLLFYWELWTISSSSKAEASYFYPQSILFKSTVSHPGSSVQPVLHDSDELLVGQLVIVIHIEDLEDGVHEVACQLQPSGHIHRSRKLVWWVRPQKRSEGHNPGGRSGRLIASVTTLHSPCPMEREAKLYICMAMAKSSRLLRNWKKDLNSSKVIPWKRKTKKKPGNEHVCKNKTTPSTEHWRAIM